MEFKGPSAQPCQVLVCLQRAAWEVEDRWNLSQLIHYVTLPPIAEDRLERTATGDILYKLKNAWNDGNIGIELSSSELIEKLIALIPRSRVISSMPCAIV